METTTFQEQSAVWLHQIQNRRKSPVKLSSVTQFRSHLKLINARIGHLPLAEINNKTLRDFIPALDGRSPQTINCYINVVKSVIKSCVDENGEIVHTRTWNSDFMDLPEVRDQNQPCFTGQQVADIVSRGNGEAMLFKVCGATGLRIGEALALEPRHVQKRTIIVEQSRWQDQIWEPKTANGFREVDITEALASQLQGYIQGKTRVFDYSYSNILIKLHSILDDLKIVRCGPHAFRRFRVTHLRKSNVREDLLKFWIGHAEASVTDKYSKLRLDTEFRLTEAERIGVGF